MTSTCSNDRAWEKEQIPKVSARGVGIAFAIYAIWLVFLAVTAAQRWFGGLQ